MNMNYTTYDWINIPSELNWKFSVYDISMELPLDYSLHPRNNNTRFGKWRFSEKDLIDLALKTSYEDEPEVTFNLMTTAMWNTDCEHKRCTMNMFFAHRENISTFLQ